MTNKHIKVIASDLDGTLLDDEKRVSDRTKRVLEKAAEKGVMFVPTTGRPFCGIPKEVLELPGVRYVITANGARIVDLKENKTIYEKLLPYEKGLKVFDILSEYDCFMEAYYEGKGYAKKDRMKDLELYIQLPSMLRYIRNSRITVNDIQEYYIQRKDSTDKIQGFFRNKAEMQEAWKRIEDTIEGVEVAGALDCNIEVGARGVNKGNGLSVLSKITGNSLDEIIAFGDGGNDVSMIQTAGIGVAMSNGCESAKNSADIIAMSNVEDGVAKTIETYVLNK